MVTPRARALALWISRPQVANIVGAESSARVLRGPLGSDATGGQCELPSSQGLSLLSDHASSSEKEESASIDEDQPGTAATAGDDGAAADAPADASAVAAPAAAPSACTTDASDRATKAGAVTPNAGPPGSPSSSAAVGACGVPSFGGLVIETAGACWALPEFQLKMQARPLIAPLIALIALLMRRRHAFLGAAPRARLSSTTAAPMPYGWPSDYPRGSSTRTSVIQPHGDRPFSAQCCRMAMARLALPSGWSPPDDLKLPSCKAPPPH